MNLVEYLDYKVANNHESKRARMAWAACRKTVSCFIGENNGIDILQAALPEWVAGYYEFLKKEYRSNKTSRLSPDDNKQTERFERIAGNYMEIFRRLIRHAISDGVMSNIDALSDIPGYRRSKNVVAPNYRSELRKLVNLRLKTGKSLVARYLICLACCGIDVETFDDIISQYKSGKQKIYLPHLKHEIKVTPSLKSLIDGYISKYDKVSIPALGSDGQTASKMYALFDANGVRLMRGKDVFADWLSLIRESGASDTLIKDLIGRRFGGEDCSDDNICNVIDEFVSDVAADCLSLRKDNETPRWYAMKTFGRSAEDVADEIREVAACNPEGMGVNDLYVPYKNRKKGSNSGKHEEKPHASVLKNLLFFNTGKMNVARLAASLNNIWIFQEQGVNGRRYIPVPYHEIYHLQRVLSYLDNMPDVDAELLSQDEMSQKFSMSALNSGEKVRIIMPGYEQYEAVVVEKQKPREGHQSIDTYVVALQGALSMNLKLSFPRDLLKVENCI